MRRALYKDKSLVINILNQSFKHDPHIKWLLSNSRNTKKIQILMEYVFDETLNRGEIYINIFNNAIALFITEKKEKVSLRYIYRNIRFLFLVGMRATIKILKEEKSKNKIITDKEYYYLYFIGVLQPYQRKGLGGSLLEEIINNKIKKNIPIYLETANQHNLKFYNNLGFHVFKEVVMSDITIYFMKSMSRI